MDGRFRRKALGRPSSPLRARLCRKVPDCAGQCGKDVAKLPESAFPRLNPLPRGPATKVFALVGHVFTPRRREGRTSAAGRPSSSASSGSSSTGTGTNWVVQPHQAGMWKRSPRLPPVRAHVLGTHAHDGDLPSTGPAGPGRAPSAGGVEPDRRSHSITSSARASTAGGIERPRAFAVLRFTTKWNRVGCSTGRSLARAPRRSRSM
jgi:hypothetical protein